MKTKLESIIYYPVYGVKLVATVVSSYVTGFISGFKDGYSR